MANKGTCEKHGEFILSEGCPQCIADRMGEEGNTSASIAEALRVAQRSSDVPPAPREMEEGLNSVWLTLIGADKSATLTSLALRPGEDIEVHNQFQEACKLLEYAEARIINTLEDAKSAAADLIIISNLKKAMDDKRKEKLAPHKVMVDAIQETYTHLMTPVLEAERITKGKQLIFLQEQKRIQQEQEEINRKRMEAAEAEMRLKGELSESVNLVEVTEAPKRVLTDLGSTGLTDHWVYEVVNFAALPDEYKVADSALLNAIARKHHDQKQVPGVRFYNEPYLATRTK